MTIATEIAQGVYVVDTIDGGIEERTGIYIIKRDKIAIIDTCTSKAVPRILAALDELDIAYDAVDYLIVTHVHLDHAGGAGLLLQSLPNAQFYVHPKGARHLIDPTRLIESARSVYGEQFNELFDPIVPIPQERVVLAEHETRVSMGDADFVFYDTPGHARHHISIYDEASNSMFVGDTTGVNFPVITKAGYDLVLPSTSPNQYDPDEMEASIAFYESLALDRIFLGHYSKVEPPTTAYTQVRFWTPIFLSLTKKALAEAPEAPVDRLVELLLEKITEDAVANGYTGELQQHILNDVVVSSQGLVHYFSKK